MSSLDILKSKYKPFRYTINKNVTIVESTSGKFVIKKENKDVYELFNYLESRGFRNYPNLILNYQDKENVFEYVDNIYVPNEQKLKDLSSVMASLHNKTVYFKNVSLDNYKEIKENILDNIKYLKVYFESLFLKFLKVEYQSPSQYLFCRNYYKYKEALNFSESEVEKWYELVQSSSKQRVSIVNNNLEMNHFRNDGNISKVINWDNYKIDSPILDFINFYHKEYLNYDLSEFLENYLRCFELLEHEKKLLFAVISIPFYFEIEESEYKNINILRKNIDYLFITEKLIRPYYSVEKEK